MCVILSFPISEESFYNYHFLRLVPDGAPQSVSGYKRKFVQSKSDALTICCFVVFLLFLFFIFLFF